MRRLPQMTTSGVKGHTLHVVTS